MRSAGNTGGCSDDRCHAVTCDGTEHVDEAGNTWTNTKEFEAIGSRPKRRPNAGDESGWQLIRCPCGEWFRQTPTNSHWCPRCTNG